MANASSEALIEARRPHRAYVLRKLIERQAGTHPNKLIPITEIILNTEFSASAVRTALRGLYGPPCRLVRQRYWNGEAYVTRRVEICE
jgi:hypothetical protein